MPELERQLKELLGISDDIYEELKRKVEGSCTYSCNLKDIPHCCAVFREKITELL